MKNIIVLLGMLLVVSCTPQQTKLSPEDQAQLERIQAFKDANAPTYTVKNGEIHWKTIEDYQNAVAPTVKPTEKIKRIKVQFTEPMKVSTGELDPWGDSPRLSQEKEEVDPEFHESFKRASKANKKLCLDALNGIYPND